MARTKQDTRPTCDWTPDEDGNWQTECRKTFIIINGTPTENDMRFCCYCGARLRERKFKEPT